MLHHDVYYFVAFMSHVIGLMMVIYVVFRHDEKFKNSNIKNLFRCEIEQHFLTLWLSFTVNVLAIIQIWPRWYGDRQILSNDFLYLCYHLGVGAMVVINHLMTNRELKRRDKGLFHEGV